MDSHEISAHMAVYAISPDVQAVQTQFRTELLNRWGILPGAKVLEIGCGQGDMTAVLAAAVGDKGHVTAVDIADPSYGAPITLGDSAAALIRSPLGRRITFHFEYDVLDPAHLFEDNAFDYVVMAHCSWYFANLDQIRQTLQHIRPWARRLCFSEWDIEPQGFDQTAHLLSVLIQGQIEAHRTDSEANVRTPFSKAKLRKMLQTAGWEETSENAVDSSALQDARWEIDNCLHAYAVELDSPTLPAKVLSLLGSQVDVLRSLAASGAYRALPSYTIVAK
ncbi:MAG: class I SAM-dependent methyltransferase [Capsulimonas sp.]|uniref:class I SAM-dependent methyltransferase n=1 Tax=Capsulimonas sp. TaxID=2494211 RepID=UPI0032662E97